MGTYSESAPSPTDIWHIIFRQQWLFGAIISVAAATLEGLGLVLQKKAHYMTMGEKVEKFDPLPAWGAVLTSKKTRVLFWLGLLLFLLHSPTNFVALKNAPETTVVPLNAFLVIFNFFLSFGVLYERFTRRDINATLVCIIGLLCMNSAISKPIPGHLEDFPVETVIQLSRDIFTNVGFACYIVVCSALFLMCLYIVNTVSMLRVVKPFAYPLLVGLLYAMFHFFSRISMTLIARAEHYKVKEDPLYRTMLVATGITYFVHLLAISASVRQLSCRFLVPALFVTTEGLTVFQDILFFREWETMTNSEIWFFFGAFAVSVISLFYISSEHRVLYSPTVTVEVLNSPLLRDDAVRAHRSILAIMDEYKIRIPDTKTSAPLKTITMNVNFEGKWRAFPICICVLLSVIPIALWAVSYPFSAFTFLTIFSMYQGWKMGAFISLFAYVGIKKIAHFEHADFKTLYDQETKSNKSSAAAAGPKWKDIVHFVVLPNYKEELDDLRMAINSVACSGIAKKQIGLVLAMEAREKEAEEKANLLISEYNDKFMMCLATYHPVGLPGEVPGKSANTRWATAHLLHDVLPKKGLDLSKVVLTVGDADSEFHSEYFAALTYYYICAGSDDGTTPLRYLTIWQPPILHMKNYITQPAVVRLASFITSEHELANLADPNAARVPYSTYSISAALAQDVGGWDPDWISEDWHMALKCFMATGGRLKVTPIFLPILNNTPAAETLYATIQARWTQAKRHALGFSELTYFNEHFPRIFSQLDTRFDKAVFAWRSVFLWVKLLMIHVFMAVFFVISPLNGWLIAFFNHHQVTQAININSWTFLVNCVFQAISLISFACVFVVSVLLYELVKKRVDGSNDANISITWRSRRLHFLTVIPQSLLYLPIFFVAAGLAEWIAAWKTAQTKGGGFKYVTATEGARQAGGKTADA